MITTTLRDLPQSQLDALLRTAETLTGEQQVNEPDQIALYDRFFSLLREAAAHGPDAVAIIHRALMDPRAAPN